MVLWRTSEIGSFGSGTGEAKENYRAICSLIDNQPEEKVNREWAENLIAMMGSHETTLIWKKERLDEMLKDSGMLGIVNKAKKG